MWNEKRPNLEIRENSDGGIENQNTEGKTEKEYFEDAENFYNLFSPESQNRKRELSESEEEQLFLIDVEDMDENTALDPVESDCVDEPVPTEEELKQWDEEDPGYVNDKVLDYENISGTKNNTYCKTGLHTGAIYWGNYAEGEKKYEILTQGKLLSRWGDEDGTFMSDVNVDYDKLELPIIKEKNVQNFYEVIKPFPVETTKIAKQPWNRKENEEQGSDERSEPALQYKAWISVEKLVEQGYLRKL